MWLGYQKMIGRESLLHEASIRYPFADALTAGGVRIKHVNLEVAYPMYAYKRADVTIQVPSALENDSIIREIDVACEMKIAKRATQNTISERNRVFSDLARLAYLSMLHEVECYFLMFGTYGDFKTYFVGDAKPPRGGGQEKMMVSYSTGNRQPELSVSGNTAWRSSGVYVDWFGFRCNEERENVFTENDDCFRVFHESHVCKNDYPSLREYCKNRKQLKISTKCEWISAAGHTERVYAGGIWRIRGYAVQTVD
jgi:hypothetical protein